MFTSQEDIFTNRSFVRVSFCLYLSIQIDIDSYVAIVSNTSVKLNCVPKFKGILQESFDRTT